MPQTRHRFTSTLGPKGPRTRVLENVAGKRRDALVVILNMITTSLIHLNPPSTVYWSPGTCNWGPYTPMQGCYAGPCTYVRSSCMVVPPSSAWSSSKPPRQHHYHPHELGGASGNHMQRLSQPASLGSCTRLFNERGTSNKANVTSNLRELFVPTPSF